MLRNLLDEMTENHKTRLEELFDPFYGYHTAEDYHKEDILGWYLGAVGDIEKISALYSKEVNDEQRI